MARTPRRRRARRQRRTEQPTPRFVPPGQTELVVRSVQVPCPFSGRIRLRTAVVRQAVTTQPRRTAEPDWLARALAADWVTRQQHDDGRWYERLCHAAMRNRWVTLRLPYEREAGTDDPVLSTHYALPDLDTPEPADLLTAVRRYMRRRPDGPAALRLLDAVLVHETERDPEPAAMRWALDALRATLDGRQHAESTHSHAETERW